MKARRIQAVREDHRVADVVEHLAEDPSGELLVVNGEAGSYAVTGVLIDEERVWRSIGPGVSPTKVADVMRPWSAFLHEDGTLNETLQRMLIRAVQGIRVMSHLRPVTLGFDDLLGSVLAAWETKGEPDHGAPATGASRASGQG